jgi:hypothetical protein
MALPFYAEHPSRCPKWLYLPKLFVARDLRFLANLSDSFDSDAILAPQRSRHCSEPYNRKQCAPLHFAAIRRARRVEPNRRKLLQILALRCVHMITNSAARSPLPATKSSTITRSRTAEVYDFATVADGYSAVLPMRHLSTSNAISLFVSVYCDFHPVAGHGLFVRYQGQLKHPRGASESF